MLYEVITIYTASQGIDIGTSGESMWLYLSNVIHPAFSFLLIIGTLLILIVSATLVSFIPARKISKLNPVNALKGKIS